MINVYISAVKEFVLFTISIIVVNDNFITSINFQIAFVAPKFSLIVRFEQESLLIQTCISELENWMWHQQWDWNLVIAEQMKIGQNELGNSPLNSVVTDPMSLKIHVLKSSNKYFWIHKQE